MTALEIGDALVPLAGKTMLIIGAGGGVGSFLIQAAAQPERVVANVRDSATARVRRYGAAETIDHTKASVIDAARHLHPEGIDVLVDLANDAPEFAALARLVKRGGTALTTRYVADIRDLATAGVQRNQLPSTNVGRRAPAPGGPRPTFVLGS